MPKVFFGKEIYSNSYFVAGTAVPFEPLPGNHGVIALEPPKDENLIVALNQAADAHVGGIYRMTEGVYEAKKTAAQSQSSQPRLRGKEMLRNAPKNPFERRNSPTAVADAPPANPPPAPIPPALPFTHAALKKIEPPPVTSPPAVPAVSSQPAEKPAEAPVEGFRPSPRRIKRTAVPAVAPAAIA